MAADNAPLLADPAQPQGFSGYSFASPSLQPTVLNVATMLGGLFNPSSWHIFSPAYGASANSFSGIDPNLLTAAFDHFQETGNQALGTVSNFGGYLFQGTQTTLSGWEVDQTAIAKSVAATMQEAVDKSAKACSGFFSCLFG